MYNIILTKNSFSLKYSFSVIQKHFYSDLTVSALPRLKSLEKSDRHRTKKLFQKNFIENLFLNNFQNTILEYPEIDSLKEVKSLEENVSYLKKLLNNCETTEEKHMPKTEKANNSLKTLELSGFQLPIGIGGFGYQNSEYIYMQEALGTDLSLMKTISQNEDFGVKVINRYGTVTQKEKYLSDLVSAKVTACFAHSETEPIVTLDPITVSTKAVIDSNEKTLSVSGKKNWVYNALHSDILIFSANVIENSKETLTSKPTLFVVDKKLNGITVKKQNNCTGLEGLDICEVLFERVVIPYDSILGEIHQGSEIIKGMLSSSYLSTSTHSLSIMKSLLNATVNHCISNKLFKKNKYERDFFKIKIGNLVSTLYVLESMTYLLAGRLDEHDDADLFLESAILKVFSSESLQQYLREILAITDTKLLENNDMQKIFNLSHYIFSNDNTNDYLRLIISTAGCKHILNFKEQCNIFKRFWSSISFQELISTFTKHNKIKVQRKKKLNGYLHLVLEEESFILEDMTLKLKECSMMLIKKFGEDIFERQIELQLLANLVIDIYSLVALLGRASRAYCLSVKHQEIDKSIAESEAERIRLQFLKTLSLLENNAFVTSLQQVGLSSLNYKRDATNYPFVNIPAN